ncbi:MAG: hypothetical protein ACRC1K_17505 [Planctomycetia bacterium]
MPLRLPNLSPRLVALLLAVQWAGASTAGEPAVVVEPAGCETCRPCVTLESLTKMSCCELENFYRTLSPGATPIGCYRGRPILCGGSTKDRVRMKLIGAAWKGKCFSADGTCLVNQWAGFKAIRAAVHPGTSWFDGGPVLEMDYQHTSTVWKDTRDELREVSPGLYLGRAYKRQCPCPEFSMFFALQAECR